MKIKISSIVFLSLLSFQIKNVSADDMLINPSNELSTSMQSLYSSAQKLSMGNSILAVRLNEVNMKLNALQLRLKQLAVENSHLSEEAMKLQDVNPAKARKIADLEKESFDIDAQVEDLRTKIKADADAMALAPTQALRLDRRLNELGILEYETKAPDDLNSKEKLQILKKISESKQRQSELYAKISSGQIALPQVQVQSAQEKNALLASIKQTQSEIDVLSKSFKSSMDNDVAADFKQMQMQVSLLQKNHDELEDLALRMQQKAQAMQKNVDQRAEYNRLKDNLDAINKEAKRMKFQVTDLRIQMVELDKRKTYLESSFRKQN